MSRCVEPTAKASTAATSSDRHRRPARADPARLPRRRGEGQGRRHSETKAEGQGRHPGLARRRPGHHRHVGHQARRPRGHPRRVQADRHHRRRRADRRAPARRWPQVADKVTIVRSLLHTIPSHGPATVFMTTGNKPTAGPAVPGARLARGQAAAGRRPACRPTSPSATSAAAPAGLAGYLGTGLQPVHRRGRPAAAARAAARGGNFSVRGITLPTRLHPRRPGEPRQAARKASTAASRGARQVDRPRRRPRRLPPAGARNPALRQDQEGVRPRRREAGDAASCYGNTPFGQGALAARRLVEAGVRFVTVSLGGWDTHGQNFDAHKTRLLPTTRPDAVGPDRRPRRPRPAGQHDRRSAPASSAGRRRSTRTPAATTGRGRWPCVLAGGGFKRGYAHGTTDAQGMAPATEPCTPDDVVGHDLPQPRHRPAPRNCKPRPAGRSSCSARAR